MPELSIGVAWRWEHGAGERQLARRLRVLCRKIAPHTAAAGGSASSTAAAAALGAEGFAVRQLEGRGLAAEVLFPDALPVRGDRVLPAVQICRITLAGCLCVLTIELISQVFALRAI